MCDMIDIYPQQLPVSTNPKIFMFVQIEVTLVIGAACYMYHINTLLLSCHSRKSNIWIITDNPSDWVGNRDWIFVRQFSVNFPVTETFDN